MRCVTRHVWIVAAISVMAPRGAIAQKVMTWQQVKAKFEAVNPTLRAAQIGIEEARAQEITAYLRPNPGLIVATDGTQLAPYRGVWQPFVGTQFTTGFSYLRERAHKRELRFESAQQGTAITDSQRSDLERGLLFSLRSAFVQSLQAKSVLALAKENLDYFDKQLAIARERFARWTRMVRGRVVLRRERRVRGSGHPRVARCRTRREYENAHHGNCGRIRATPRSRNRPRRRARKEHSSQRGRHRAPRRLWLVSATGGASRPRGSSARRCRLSVRA